MTRLTASVPNFRAVAPYRARDGRYLKRDTIFRSEALYGASREALEAVEVIGLRAVCDLRTPMERERFPTTWSGEPPPILAFKAPSANAAAAVATQLDMMRDGTGALARAHVLRLYDSFADMLDAEQLRGLVTALSQGQAPVLIHCTAGKDRTGFVVALLLDLLGVAWEDIVDDYMATRDRFGFERIIHVFRSFTSVDEEFEVAAAKALEVKEEYLEVAFEAARRRYGGSEGLLQARCGIDAATIGALRDALLETHVPVPG